MAWASCYTADFQAASTVGAAAGTTAANDRRLLEAVLNAAGVSFVSGTIDVGRPALRIDPSSLATNVGVSLMASASRYAGMMCRFSVPSLAANAQWFRMIASTTTDNILIRVQSSGLIDYSFNGGTSFTSSGVSIVASRTYGIEVFVDWNTGTTHTLKVRLNGVEIINATGGASTVTAAQPVIGSAAVIAQQIDITDIVTYNDVGQYGLMSDWRVYGVEPTSDGTHSMTANDFQDASANNLSNSTTGSWDWVNDAPSAAPTVVDFVQQVVLRTTSYMEWVLNTATIPATSGTPVLVCLAAAMHPVASANANSVAFRLNSGGNVSTEAAIDTSVASNTLEYRKHHYTTEPTSGAAWTLAMVQALRARFGYSGDATPPPALDSIMAFVVVPTSQPARKPAVTSTAVNRSYTW